MGKSVGVSVKCVQYLCLSTVTIYLHSSNPNLNTLTLSTHWVSYTRPKTGEHQYPGNVEKLLTVLIFLDTNLNEEKNCDDDSVLQITTVLTMIVFKPTYL